MIDIRAQKKHDNRTHTPTSMEMENISIQVYTSENDNRHIIVNDDNGNNNQKVSHGTGISVLAVGDPHFKLSNLDEISAYMQKIIRIIKVEDPDFVVILGDLLHTHERVHTTVLNKVYMFIHELRKHKEVYILVGNHDYINNSQFLSTNHWMNAMKEWENVFVVDEGLVYTSEYGKFIFCPYVYPGKFTEALDIIDSDWKTARCIFCHQEFFGCKMGAIVSEEGDKWALSAPFVISGHIHDRQQSQDNIFYTGSSMQHSFGESVHKSISICCFEEIIRIRNIELELAQKKILYMDIEDIKEYVPDRLKSQKECMDKTRITLTGNYDEFKQFRKSKKYKQLIENGIQVVYKPKIVEQSYIQHSVEHFHDILYKLIQKEGNNDLEKLYKNVCLNNHTS